MTLWGYGAKSGSGWNEVDTVQTVMTTRAPAVLKKMTNKRHGTALQFEMSAQDKISQNSEHSASQTQWALICMPITFYSPQLEEIR